MPRIRRREGHSYKIPMWYDPRIGPSIRHPQKEDLHVEHTWHDGEDAIGVEGFLTRLDRRSGADQVAKCIKKRDGRRSCAVMDRC